LYRHPRFEEGYLCERDTKRFRKVQHEVFTTTWQLVRNYKKLKKAYREMYSDLVSTESWKARCGIDA